MAGLARIREALGAALDTIDRLVVYPTLVSVANLGDGGGVVVGGFTTGDDYYTAMGRGTITWRIPLYLLYPTSEYSIASNGLDELVTPVGGRSIPQLIWDRGRVATGGLGLLDEGGEVDLDLRVVTLSQYGVEFPVAGTPHIGAILECAAVTDPRLA